MDYICGHLKIYEFLMIIACLERCELNEDNLISAPAEVGVTGVTESIHIGLGAKVTEIYLFSALHKCIGFYRRRRVLISEALEDLWTACGAAGEFRLLVDREGQSAIPVGVRAPFAVLGSQASCDVVLKDDRVSRRHAYLQIIAGRLWCFDLESRTGIRLNSRRKSNGWVEPKEGVQLGRHVVRSIPGELLAAELEDNDNQPVTALPWDQDSLPSVTLEFLNATPDSGEPPVWRLDRLLTFVGQSHLCKIRFACPSISRFHCSLLRTPLGVWILDLVSREGVILNGERTRWARLQAGDQVQLGKFRIGIRVAKPRQLRDHLGKPALLTMPAASGVGPLVPERLLQDKTELPGTTQSAAETIESGAPAENLPSVVNMPATIPGAFSFAPGAPPPSLPQPAFPSEQPALQFLMSQFSAMQQQMFEQFQNSTLMMMQMFCALQKDQFDVVRKELDEIRNLNREINSLQAELAKSRSMASTSASGMISAAFSFGPPASVFSMASDVSNRATAVDQDFPLPERVSSNLQSIGVEDSAVSQAPSAMATPATLPPTDGNANQPSSQENKSAEAVQKGPEVHDWLCQRFTELQAERQNRWQRLMSKLLGK